MKLSIVIPVYNAGRYLKRCLDSILAQSMKEKEIICVDDGSTDDSFHIIKEYAEKYDNIYVLQQKNKFAGMARNYGLSIAKGEYIHFMDADDYILNDIYSQVYATAINLNADYIKTRNVAFDRNGGRQVNVLAYTLKNINIRFFNQRISLNTHPEALLYSSVAPWCGWVKKSYIEEKKMRFNHLKCVNDRSFYADVIGNTDRIVLCDAYMVAHQVRNHESLVGQRCKNYSCCLESYQIIENNTRNLPIDIRKKLMTFELYSIMKGYGELTKEQKKENEDLLKKFLETINWKEIDVEILLNPFINEITEKFEIDLKQFFNMNIIINSIVELESSLIHEKDIVIYGAGKVAVMLVKYIRKRHSHIKLSVMVSDVQDNPAFIFEIPVKKRSEELLEHAKKIIIAALDSASIYLDLVSAGYENIQVAGDTIYEELHLRG